MRDHDRHAGRAPDRKTLFEAVEYPVALVAHMRRVERARRMQQSGQRLDLGRRRVLRRSIGEAARQAHRAGVERFLQQFAHTADLGCVGRPVECCHRANAQRRMANKAGSIDCRRAAIERHQVIGKAAIPVIGGIADQVERRRRRMVDRQRR